MVLGRKKAKKVDFGKSPIPTFIQVPTIIDFLENFHAYSNQGAYAYQEVKSSYCPSFLRNQIPGIQAKLRRNFTKLALRLKLYNFVGVHCFFNILFQIQQNCLTVFCSLSQQCQSKQKLKLLRLRVTYQPAVLSTDSHNRESLKKTLCDNFRAL